jgi:hypothetical protein
MCEINEKENQDMTFSMEMFEIDIYQLFVQMRQVTPRQMFLLLFSHLGLTNYNWERQMNATHGVYSIANTLALLVVHSSSSSVRFDSHGLYAVRTPTVVVYRQGSNAFIEILCTLVIPTM